MGSNSQQAFETINQGMGLVQNMTRQMHGPAESKNPEAEASLLETNARGDALEARQRARKDAQKVRDYRERERSGERADWGGSNLEMSGSKEVVRDAKALRDRQEEDDVLFEGQQDADAILRRAKSRANMLRVNEGGSTTRSILSLGSKIYGPRR